MPESKRSKPSLAELVERRRAIPPIPEGNALGSLSERFLVPPFSVLDARQGYWQNRKKAWLALGIQSELGRGENGHNAVVAGSPMPATHAKASDGSTIRGNSTGKPLSGRAARCVPGHGSGKNSAWMSKGKGGYQAEGVQHGRKGRRLGKAFNCAMDPKPQSNNGEWSNKDDLGCGTSIFDPVLCELAYRWFCPRDGRVLDPFAGGSVRGIIAAMLGRSYCGVDLRPEQAEANCVQAERLCPDADLRWVVGDAADVLELLPGKYDFMFSCPPYADLERYSDDPRDLSTMEYESFLRKYRHIVAVSCSMLQMDRFACFVVGDVRDRATGYYRNFVGDTIRAFRDAGMELYNDAVLLTAVGSLPIRVGYQFAQYRKLGKTHQNVLVFVKGDAKKATENCGPVDVDDLDMPKYIEDAIAVCEEDADGWELEVRVIDEPTINACLIADILRDEARRCSKPLPRVWSGRNGNWERVGDDVNLSYIVGDVPYLNTKLFSEATRPVDTPLQPERV